MSRRNRTTLSPKLCWVVALAALLLGSSAEARRGASWNRPTSGNRLSQSQQAGRSYTRHMGNYRSSLRAAQRQSSTALRSGDKGLMQRAEGNYRRAISAKAKMFSARSRGLDAKKEAAFRKAQALEKAGDKAGAEAWLNKAIRYESRAKSMSKAAARLNTKAYQDKLVKRAYSRFSRTKAPTATATMGTSSTGYQKSVKPWKAAGKSYGKQYNSYRKAQLQHKQAAKSAYQRYRQTGDAQALQQSRVAGVQRLRAKASMYKVQAQALEAKAAAAAKAGDVTKANRYSARAHKVAKRAAGLTKAVDRFESKLQAGQLRNPRVRQASNDEIEDGPSGPAGDVDMDFSDDFDMDGPEMGGSAPKVQQAMDGEGAPGIDGPKVRGIGSYRGKKTVKAQLSSGNIMGALGTLQQMEAQGNRRGVMGMVDRYRKWSTKRRIMKHAYRAGKDAAKIGDVEMADQSLQAITALGRPGWRTNRKVNKIANNAISAARKAATHRNPEMARELLQLAQGIQMASKNHTTWRFRRTRNKARSRLWKDIKRRAKSGNIEAFRSAVRLASAYAQEDGHKMTGKEFGRLKKLTLLAKKRSVVRALDDAKQLLKFGASPEEAQARLVYAMETADQLAKRGVTVKTGLFHRSVGSKFNKVRKMLIKAIQSGNAMEQKKPGLFSRWFKMNRGPAINVAPRPRTTAQVAQDRRMQREQQQMAAIQQALMSGEISPEQLPPEMLQQMGFQPPPANMMQ